jgi:hypothetical protein
MASVSFTASSSSLLNEVTRRPLTIDSPLPSLTFTRQINDDRLRERILSQTDRSRSVTHGRDDFALFPEFFSQSDVLLIGGQIETRSMTADIDQRRVLVGLDVAQFLRVFIALLRFFVGQKLLTLRVTAVVCHRGRIERRFATFRTRPIDGDMRSENVVRMRGLERARMPSGKYQPVG